MANRDVLFNGLVEGATPAAAARILSQEIDQAQRAIEPPTLLTFSATPTFDASTASTFRETLTASVTSSTITNPTDGQVIKIVLTQGGAGSFTFAWPANCAFVGGTAPTLTTASGKTDMVCFQYNLAATKWQEQYRALNV